MTTKKEKESTDGIVTKLSRIQSQLNAPKGQTNAFGKYKYRSCEDILEALKPLLAKEGCVLVMRDEIVQVGERIYVRAKASIYTDCEYGVDDAWGAMHAQAFAREPITKKGMDDAQLTGATSSYARKYALNGLFAIDDCKDADTMDNRASTPAPVVTPPKVDIQQAQTQGFGEAERIRQAPAFEPEPTNEPQFDDGQYEAGAMYQHVRKELGRFATEFSIPKKPMNDWITGTFGKTLASMKNDDGLLTVVLASVEKNYMPTVGAVKVGGVIPGKEVR